LMDDAAAHERNAPKGLVLPSLLVSSFATYPPTIVTSILLVELGAAFGLPVGAMGQIRTVTNLVAVAGSLLVGALSVRHNHRSLLLAGLLSLGVSAMGSGASSSFSMLLAFSGLTGLGMAMVVPMTNTLVAEHFPVERRPHVLGLIGVGGGLGFILGGPVASFMEGVGGWRLPYMGYATLIPLIGFLFVAKGLPSNPPPSTGGGSPLEGFIGVCSNRSAVACLLGNLLASAAVQGLYFYSTSLFKERFHVSGGLAGLIYSGASLCFVLGSYASGWTVKKIGRKPVTIAGVVMFSITTVLFPRMPDLWMGVSLVLIGSIFEALRFSASSSLILEQAPAHRGTMMSLSSAAVNLGYALGAGVGGLALLWYGWETMGVILGGAGLAAATLFQLMAVDPTRQG
jgi:DHA1 family putative efflux transporter-like MFS transporter